MARNYGLNRCVPDEVFRRERMYSISAAAKAKTLPTIDLTKPALPRPFADTWNQGHMGSCGPTTAAELICLGLNGTNIYHKDDPTWIRFRPPVDARKHRANQGQADCG